MNRYTVLLALQGAAVFVVLVGLGYYLTRDPVVEEVAPEPDATAEPPVLAEPVEVFEVNGKLWVALERMDYLVGAWAMGGDGLVSVAASGSPEAYGFTLGPWRLAIERPGEPFVLCGVYSRLQRGESMSEPWRLAYCQGLAADPEATTATQVFLFRSPGQEPVRLKVGAYLDVEITQVQ